MSPAPRGRVRNSRRPSRRRAIPRSTRLAEAPSFGKPIIHYDKYSPGSAAYELLTQEFLTRIDRS